MFGYGQAIIDDIKNQLIAEWKRTSTTTVAPLLVFEGEADLSVHNPILHESNDVTLDQSNNRFSFVNIH